MNSERLKRLEQAAQFTDEMLGCAREARWSELLELEAKRAVLLDDYQAMTRVNGEDHDLEARLLSRIIESNHQIAVLGEHYRQLLAESLTTSRRQRRAAGAYSSSASKRFS